jgi:hypothetical protein
MFSIVALFYPKVCPKFNSHVYKLKRWALSGMHLFLFCNWGSKEVLPCRSAQCSKKNDDGPMDMTFSKNKINCTHESINMITAGVLCKGY